MFEKLSQMAEQAATSVSRRQFLGRFGRAAALAAAAGTLLAQPTRADPKRGTCDYSYSQTLCQGLAVGTQCGYRSKCVAVTDLGGGLYACACRSRERP